MKMYVGVEVQLPSFLISALDGGEWLASCPSCFTPRGTTPVSNGEKAGLGPKPV